MAQAAMRQTMAEITDYLAKIDQKVDDVLRKVDNTVVAPMVGAGHAIERALTIREETGGVDETLWSTVDETHQTIAATQTYAFDQTRRNREEVESTKVRGLAGQPRKQKRGSKWLAVSHAASC